MEFINSNDLDRLAPMGTSCPDHFLRTKISPLVLGLTPAQDLSDVASIKAAIKEIAQLTGNRVDVLVNNAALRPDGRFLEMSDAEWRRVISVDLDSSVWLSRACLPGMLDRGWGRIVNLLGMNAIHGYNGRAAVSVSKHGLWGLTKALAKEFGAKGITTNAVSPGPIAGERDDEAAHHHIASMVSRVPVGRLGQPHEVAAVVSMLVSEGGAFVNGQMIQVNGGAET
jgi:3-oxoacyl-[acyl-carrier protein] reductase